MAGLVSMPPSDVRDEELVRRAQGGDQGALERLVRRWHGTFVSAALRLLAYRRHDAEEAVQELWLRVHRSLSSLRDASSWRYWAYRILHHICLDLIRASRPYARVLGSAEGSALVPVEPEAREEGSQRQRELAAWIQRMPEAYRRAVILRYLQKLTYAEMAEVLDISIGAAKSDVCRGLVWLEKRLEKGHE
jgi:RNA polymerase sigma-70 factor (ECF subfamily)